MLPEKNRSIFFIFLSLSLALRFYSFFQGVIDHDESTYLIIGRDLAMGKHLYVDVTDTKPVGIFLIYALFFKIFGYSLFLPRMMVAVVVAMTSWLLFRISLKLSPAREVAFAAGIIYILYTSIWSQFGISPNTEQFFNLATASGLLLALNHKTWGYLCSGLIFGIGFIIKYLVLFDFVFLFVFFFIRELYLNQWKIKETGVVKFFLAGIGFSLPFLLTNLYFWVIGDFEAFRYITYQLPSKYGQDPSVWRYFVLLIDYSARFLPITAMFFYALLSKPRIVPRWQATMYLVWIAGVLIAMYLPGRSFDHYTIQLMIPFSLLAANFFHPAIRKGRFDRLLSGRKFGVPLVAAVIIVAQISGIAGVLTDKDSPRQVARYLNQNLKPGETLYLSNYKHIIYYLTKTESPTKYIHPTLLTNPKHSEAFGINGPDEIRKILETRPTYILILKPNPTMEALIYDDYAIETTFFENTVVVYRVKT